MTTKVLIIIFGSIAIYYLGVSYVIKTRFDSAVKPLNYWQSLTIFAFFIKMSMTHPFKGRRIPSLISVILLYQIFTEIFKVYYISLIKKHPELTQGVILVIAKRKFEEGITNVYDTVENYKE